MTSLYNSIYNILLQDNNISNADLIAMFTNEDPQVIRVRASEARKALRNITEGISNITIESIEPIIIKLINKNPNTNNIKLAMDLIKAKIADRGMDDDIDIDRFVKKALTTIRSQDKDDPSSLIDTADSTTSTNINYEYLTHSDSDKELEDVMKSETKYLRQLLNETEDTNIEDPDDYNEETGDYY